MTYKPLIIAGLTVAIASIFSSSVHAQNRVVCNRNYCIDRSTGVIYNSGTGQPVGVQNRQAPPQPTQHPALFRARRGAQSTSNNQAKSVVVYGTQDCYNTTSMREQLKNNGIAFEFRDVNSSPEFNQQMWNALRSGGLSNANGIPIVQIGSKVMVTPSIEDVKRELEM